MKAGRTKAGESGGHGVCPSALGFSVLGRDSGQAQQSIKAGMQSARERERDTECLSRVLAFLTLRGSGS